MIMNCSIFPIYVQHHAQRIRSKNKYHAQRKKILSNLYSQRKYDLIIEVVMLHLLGKGSAVNDKFYCVNFTVLLTSVYDTSFKLLCAKMKGQI